METAIQDYRRSHISYASVVFDISGAVTDFDVKANSDLFTRINVARELTLRTTKNLDVKFNSIDGDAISLLKSEGIDMTEIPITNIYLTTTTQGAWVRIWIIGYN